MRAAQAGSLDAVKYLLGKGAPWNALDRAGACAGEYALHGGHEDVAQELLEFGCRAELLLSAAERRMAGSAAGTGNNDGYLQQKIEYHGSEKLMDAGELAFEADRAHVGRGRRDGETWSLT